MSSKLFERPYRSRVRRPRDKGEVLDLLVNSEGSVFPTYAECLIFAAAYGYYCSERSPFELTDEPIPWDVMRNAEKLIALLAIASSRDPEILQLERFGEQLTAFEEYANGGLSLIAKRLDGADSSEQSEILAELLRESAAADGARGSNVGAETLLEDALGTMKGS